MRIPCGPLPVVLCLCASLLAPLSVRAQEARRFSDEQLEPLAASLARILDARAAGRGLDEARSALADDLHALAGADPLRLAPDLGRALWLARGYDEAKVKAGKVVSEVLSEGSFAADGIEVAYRLPKDYDPRVAYPLLLTIPAQGEDPAEHLRVNWTHAALLDGAILLSPAMPAAREVAAQEEWAQVSVNGRPGGLCRVLTALRLGVERFAADPDRVFVVGQGEGVPAAIAAGNYAPQRFAGVIGRGGDAGPVDPGGTGGTNGSPANFRNLPTLFVGGGAQAAAFQKAAQAAGFDNCELAPTAAEEAVWRWIQAHARQPAPDAVTLVVGTPFPTRAYWLRVAPSAPDARADARLERDTNTIRIDGHGVSHATLYLNDALVDLSKPVTVICNGIGTTGVLPRGLSTFLDLVADGTSDAGCVYVVEATFDMSGEEVAQPAAEPVDPDDLRALAAAGADVEKLWALYERCAAAGRTTAGALALKMLLRVDPDHAGARAALGHVRFEDRWFTSPARLERFRRGQDDAVAKDKGYVKQKGLWMHPDDRARASKGLVKDEETGLWLSVDDRRRLADGWVLQDLEWVKPEDAVLVDEGLWRVDGERGEWVDLAVANRRHARIDSMWRIPTSEVLLWSTADRDVSLRAIEVMGRALDDLQKVFGGEPALPLSVAILRDEEQYDRFAFGDPDGRRQATHAGRLHVIHSAFFAESWFPLVDGKREFRGMGVCYWDPLVPYGELYGVHSARLAVGLSYVDALDPSPKAVRQGLAKGAGGDFFAAYQAEKVLPAWLRYGGAVYAERYFKDDTAAEGGDPWWARAWSVSNLKERGGLRPLPEVFAFALDPDDREDGLKLYIEAGLLVAFLVDGGCAPADEALAAFRAALAGGRLKPSHWKALEEALAAHEAELRAFAGL